MTPSGDYMLKLILATLLAISPVLAKTIILTEKNMVVLSQEFNEASTSKVIKDVINLSGDKHKDIYLVLNTPGGSVDSGLAMIDVLNSIPNITVHTVTLFAASMGFITAQLLNGKRYITPHGVYMSHLASGGFSGSFPYGNLNSRYDYYSRKLKAIDQRVADRSNGKHSLKSYRKLINQEHWSTGKENLNHGFADEVVNLTCSKNLIKDVIEDIKINFMGMIVSVTVKKSLCPLIKGIEQVKATVNGKPYLFNNPILNKLIDKHLHKSKFKGIK